MTAWHKQLISKECTLEDIFGSTDDAEIDQTMEALNWNEAQKTMARTNYKGRRSELLEYVRGLAKSASEASGGKPVAVKAATPRAAVPKEADTAAAGIAATVTETSEKPIGTTAEASTSPGSSPAKPQAALSKEAW
jgi:peptidoglycan hydrolase CwlO-like protein